VAKAGTGCAGLFSIGSELPAYLLTPTALA